MAWVRLDDGFPEHPKVAQAGDLAAWLYVCGLTYANRQLTDGFIPDSIVPRLTGLKNPVALAKRLVSVGLWDLAEGGYQIHDFLNYQPSAAKVAQERQASAARMAASRGRRNGPSIESVAPEHAPNDADGCAGSSPATNPPQVQPGPNPVPVVEKNLKEDPPLLPDAAVAASSGGKSVSVLVSLSSDAREAVEYWRSAHGKRSPPKLNPTQAAKLEKAVAEVGLDWLRTGAIWSAERGIPEFDKAVNAAYTARQNSERGLNGSRGGSGNGKPPAARGGGGSVRHI